MRKYLPHILIISFVFILAPTVHVASCAGELEDAKELVRNNPDNAGAHFNLGVAYGANGMNKKAIKSYKQALRINPDLTKVHYNLGLAYLFSNDRGSALEQYKILKNLDTEEANKLFNEIYSE